VPNPARAKKNSLKRFPASGKKPFDRVYIITYNIIMKEIKRSDTFIKWLNKLRNDRAVARITKRIRRLSQGNPGDVEPAGEGISEMREDYGPGYRVYYKETKKEIIILLCGGDKRSQQADIANAKKIARLYEEE
jgi:putative addiction module killer protein